MLEGEIVEGLKKRNKSLDIKALSAEDFERKKENWSPVVIKFFEYVRANVSDLRVIVTEDVAVGVIFDVGLIKINEDLLTSEKEHDFESKILNLWARYLDRKIDSSLNINRLARVIVPEIFVYLVLSGGDLAEAEQCAREVYRDRRVSLLRDYSAPDFGRIKNGEQDFNEIYKQKVNWSEARARARELYESPAAREFCAALGLSV